MTVQIMKDGKAVATSRNLRGILGYARRSYVLSVGVARIPSGADIFIRFNDGASCHTQFADYSVACQWFKARRSWGLTGTVYDTADGNKGYMRFERKS